MKKYISIALIFTLIFSTAVFSAGAATVLYGDANGDKNVNVKDATLIQKHIAKITSIEEEYLVNAEVSGDDVLSVRDATLIQKKIAGIIAKFPIEETQQGGDDVDRLLNTTINVYFTNNKNWSKVNAYMWGDSPKTEWPGEAMTLKGVNDYGESTYTVQVDTSKYKWIIFNDGSSNQTVDIPLSVGSSAFFIDGTGKDSAGSYYVGTYAYGCSDEGSITTATLPYDSTISTCQTKKITVWTPPEYDKNDTTKKYAVLYMTDGQNIFGDIAKDSNCSYYEWEADENVLALMQNGADGVIVVGMDDSTSNRDSELTPDIGEVLPEYKADFSKRTGEYYSNWVVNTVMPYIEQNFNVTSDRTLTGIMGSSSGGLEAFYIGMENYNKFGFIGSLSPAYALFSDSVWDSYLSKFDFSDKNMPRIYTYIGKGDSLEKKLYNSSVAMESWLLAKGYSQSKLKTMVYQNATHNEIYWRIIFPEALSFGLGYCN